MQDCSLLDLAGLLYPAYTFSSIEEIDSSSAAASHVGGWSRITVIPEQELRRGKTYTDHELTTELARAQEMTELRIGGSHPVMLLPTLQIITRRR